MASEGEIVLSYHDVLLRESELHILQSNQWLNDVIISFWFEYLLHEVYSEFKDIVCFIAPEMVQLLKSASPQFSAFSCPISVDEIILMLQSLDLPSKKLIFFPISDSPINSTSVDGSHWSLLVYVKQPAETNAGDNSGRSSSTSVGQFEHYDSFTGSVNHSHASAVVNVVTSILRKSSSVGASDEDEPTDQKLMIEMQCSQQTNSYDCGLHLLVNCEAVCKKLLLDDNHDIIEIASLSVVKRKRLNILSSLYKLRA